MVATIYYVLLLLLLLRLTSSELQGQEEAACVPPTYATTSVLFTGTNAVKFASAVTQSS